MYVPISWLKEFVDLDFDNLDIDINKFADRMTMTGTKVETIKRIGDKINSIITGKILEITQHPDANKLVITKVDIGEKVLQIITAAKNIFVGAIVPVAIHNSVLADGTKIKKSKLRGVLSEGMFCSIEELGFTKNQYPEAPDNGIYIFDNDIEVGLDVRPILELTEDVIDFEITSNRPDCLSIYGIARETAATFDKNLKNILIDYFNLELSDKNYDIEIKNQDLCKRYMLQEIDNIKIEQSPLWLRHKLISCGINPVNNIVDITNYVILELGQPLHAFDAEKISGNKIIIRKANHGEILSTLDGTQRSLENKMLVISDKEKILALAGIMGGESSKINQDTKKILLESANFDAYNIRQTSKKLKLHTESSMRFEKNIDINLTELAIKRAIYLIKKICPDISIKTKVLDYYPIKKQEREIKLNPNKINKLLGTNISDQDMIFILNKLGFEISNFMIKIPTFRDDIEGDADIAEEILRFYGYDKVDYSLPSTATMGKKNDFEIMCAKIKNMLSISGGYEIKGFSFESPKVFEKCLLTKDKENQNSVKILNPLGEEFSILRTNMINNMLNALSVNLNKQNSDALLFEVGKTFEKFEKEDNNLSLFKEKKMLTIGAYGNNNFFVIKGLLEKLFGLFKIKKYIFKNISKEFLHPYRSAEIFIDQESVGFIGEVHPAVTKNYDIKTKIYLSSIDLEILYKKINLKTKFKSLTKFPAVYRDLCVIVDKKITNQDLINNIKNNTENILEDIKLFDVYDGQQIQDNKKSMAYKLTFRSQTKTLTEQEINLVLDKIIDNLEKSFGAKLRS